MESTDTSSSPSAAAASAGGGATVNTATPDGAPAPAAAPTSADQAKEAPPQHRPVPQLDSTSFNPFLNESAPAGLLEWVRVILLFPTLGLLRVLLVVLILLFASLLAWLVTLGWSPKRADKSKKTDDASSSSGWSGSV